MTVTFEPSGPPDGRTACQRAADTSALLRDWDRLVALFTAAPERAYGPLEAIEGGWGLTAPSAAHPASRALERAAGRD